VFDWVAKSVFELFTGSEKDRDHTQEQLKPVLERRFEPCVKLWQDLWHLADNAQKGFQIAGATQAAIDARAYDEIRALSERVDSFMQEYGVLVSVPFFLALVKLQKSLRDFDPNADEIVRRGKVSDLLTQLFPSTEKDKKGNVVGQKPGLLMLLRDEIGSNAKAGVSSLK
jgi:hypothetical protein